MELFNGLAYEKLNKALLLKTPLSKDSLTKEVKQHIELEELKKRATQTSDLRETVLKKQRPRSPRRRRVWERIQRNKGQPSWKRIHSPPPPPRGLVRFNQPKPLEDNQRRTPLWVAISEIFSQVQDKNLLLKPTRIRGASRKRDKNRPPCDRENRPREKLNSPPRVAGRIDTISRGIAGGEDSRNPRKNYSRREVYSASGAIPMIEPISFLDNKLKGIELPYDDPVLPRSHIQPTTTLLTEFTGYVVYPLGIATLDFTVGEGEGTTTIKAQFTVVDINDSSYNGLIGRPILTVGRAIVTPLYLKLKFPTIGAYMKHVETEREPGYAIKPRFPQ
ncbi:hypothetical protein LIER_31774 [Lithospermum erythrorhizon]|uniref:Uncharacterized protein n=1 Tax=Lithospermum erythrorhizon TaxID=34254 RepID=A0AAV3RX97_LITER